jgi:hypothetical protein
MRTSVARFASGLAALALQLLAIERSLGETVAKREYFTNFPNFAKLCTAFVAGYEPAPGGTPLRQPVLGRSAGDCEPDRRPVVFSVTHENAQNSHAGARNYDKNIASYMSDLDLDHDLGRWIDIGAGRDDPSAISILIDTINFNEVNVTGWPIRYGHMFAAFNDRLLNGATIDKEIIVELDVRIRKSELGARAYNGYSGNRVIIGAVGSWIEPAPRTNSIHFFETDLVQTDGYSASYGDPDYPLCKDTSYDRCFYSREGRYAEGREVRYDRFFKKSAVPANTEEWTHLRIPLSQAIRKLHWVAPPSQWRDAKITGVYVGIESQGAALTALQVRSYNVYAEKP